MKTTISVYIIIVGFALMSLLSASLIAFELQITAARNFHTNCMNRIQSSYHNEEVITDCQNKASAAGYTLNYKDVTVYGDRKSATVELEYTAIMPLLDVEREGTISSFAK